MNNFLTDKFYFKMSTKQRKVLSKLIDFPVVNVYAWEEEITKTVKEQVPEKFEEDGLTPLLIDKEITVKEKREEHYIGRNVYDPKLLEDPRSNLYDHEGTLLNTTNVVYKGRQLMILVPFDQVKQIIEQNQNKKIEVYELDLDACKSELNFKE